MQLAKGQPEAPRRRLHHLGQQSRAVAGEQPIKCTTDAIVTQPSSLRRVDAEQPGGEAQRAFLLAIHRLALDDDRAQQHAQRLRVRDAAAAVGGRHMALEQFRQPDAAQEVTDQGQRPQPLSEHAQPRIERIRSALAHHELMCSGTLSERMMKCGKPNCGCANDPAARHGPYYEWGRMRAAKQTHRYVCATQAQILRPAIANYREVRKLLREWEEHTERLIDAAEPKPPKT